MLSNASLTEAVKILQKNSKKPKIKKDSKKLNDKESSNKSYFSTSYWSFQSTWSLLETKISGILEKYQEQSIENVEKIIRKTSTQSDLPIIQVCSDSSELLDCSFYERLSQKSRNGENRDRDDHCNIFVPLYAADFTSLSVATRVIAEQCLTYTLASQINLKKPTDIRLHSEGSPIALDCIGPPTDVILHWYQEMNCKEMAVSVVIMLNDFYGISDSFIIQVIQWLSFLRRQGVKICILTGSSGDGLLFQSKIESQSMTMVSLHLVNTSSVKDAFLEIMDAIFIDSYISPDISPEVLNFLQDNFFEQASSMQEFIKILGILFLDFFLSNPFSSYIFDESFGSQLDENFLAMSIEYDDIMKTFLSSHCSGSLDKLNAEINNVLEERKVAHTILKWLSKNVLPYFQIRYRTLSLYRAALEGTLANTRYIQAVTDIIQRQSSSFDLKDVARLWHEQLQVQLQVHSTSSKSLDDTLKILNAISTRNAVDDHPSESVDTSNIKHGLDDNISSSRKGWNAAKKRKEMLRSMTKVRSEETNTASNQLLLILNKLVELVEKPFQSVLKNIFTYSSLYHLLQISGRQTFCRAAFYTGASQRLSSNSFYRHVLNSLPAGKKMLSPQEWFENSVQNWINMNGSSELTNAERDQWWTTFWKIVMDLNYKGLLHLQNNNKVSIEKAVFY